MPDPEWGTQCHPLGLPVCVVAGPNCGCKVEGDRCTNHFRGDGEDLPPGDGGQTTGGQPSRYELMESRGELCRM